VGCAGSAGMSWIKPGNVGTKGDVLAYQGCCGSNHGKRVLREIYWLSRECGGSHSDIVALNWLNHC
jgi:hypothetical protein